MGKESFSIEILDQHWQSGCAPEHDYCSHGRIRLRIGGVWIEEGVEEWGISESALALLRTLESDHSSECRVADRLIFHGCGTLLMSGCPIGIDWSVRHLDGSVHLGDIVRYDTTSEREATHFSEMKAEVSPNEYRRQVVAFARKARELFDGVTKEFDDAFDRDQYERFWAEYGDRLSSC
ncbi:MAG: hypothetical protein JW889_06115 [Verrucomicrobia bacterium]|nr:hypothetical protein [Verrucomicrobiota bacterium]